MPRYGSHPRNAVSIEWKKFAASFSSALGDCGEQLTNFSKTILLPDACRTWLHETDSKWPHGTLITRPGKTGGIVQQSFGGDRDHPWYFGQLHDSIAVRIAERNRNICVEYMPAKAEGGKAQHATAKDAGQRYDHIIGAEFAVREAYNAQYYFLPGIQMQLIVGVPYARKVDESPRHAGFISNLREDMYSYIRMRLEDAYEGNSSWRARVFRPRKVKK